jgi:ribosome-associated translation inhibitor RaiA
MQITVTFRHIEPSEGLRQYAEKRLRRLARAYGDEPRFVLAAQHMVTSGDWLVPMRGSEP